MKARAFTVKARASITKTRAFTEKARAFVLKARAFTSASALFLSNNRVFAPKSPFARLGAGWASSLSRCCTIIHQVGSGADGPKRGYGSDAELFLWFSVHLNTLH
jgi:hypothetical protein